MQLELLKTMSSCSEYKNLEHQTWTYMGQGRWAWNLEVKVETNHIQPVQTKAIPECPQQSPTQTLRCCLAPEQIGRELPVLQQWGQCYDICQPAEAQLISLGLQVWSTLFTVDHRPYLSLEDESPLPATVLQCCTGLSRTLYQVMTCSCSSGKAPLDQAWALRAAVKYTLLWWVLWGPALTSLVAPQHSNHSKSVLCCLPLSFWSPYKIMSHIVMQIYFYSNATLQQCCTARHPTIALCCLSHPTVAFQFCPALRCTVIQQHFATCSTLK